MVVPIYKKWEASLARVQIVRQEKITQLLAFFADFHHGTCMNFVLKGTDHIESFGRSGKFGIRIVDAKFALPKKDDDPASDFVCLDMPEYPIEHDDITITFDTESGKLYSRVVGGVYTNASVQIVLASRWLCLDLYENLLAWDHYAGSQVANIPSYPMHPSSSKRAVYNRSRAWLPHPRDSPLSPPRLLRSVVL